MPIGSAIAANPASYTNPVGWAALGGSLIPMGINAIRGIGSGRKAADSLVDGYQKPFEDSLKEVERLLDSGNTDGAGRLFTSALQRFSQGAQMFAGGDEKQRLVINQAFNKTPKLKSTVESITDRLGSKLDWGQFGRGILSGMPPTWGGVGGGGNQGGGDGGGFTGLPNIPGIPGTGGGPDTGFRSRIPPPNTGGGGGGGGWLDAILGGLGTIFGGGGGNQPPQGTPGWNPSASTPGTNTQPGGQDNQGGGGGNQGGGGGFDWMSLLNRGLDFGTDLYKNYSLKDAGENAARIQAESIQKAIDAQERAASESLALQSQIFNQNQTNILPQLRTGQSSIAQMAHLMGLNPDLTPMKQVGVQRNAETI